MRLKSFRILRYKSIVDSTECALAPDFTVFIGKNESGKTAVLEALRDFDAEHKGLSSQAVSISGAHANPELELTFQISIETIDAALKESGFSIPDDVKRTFLSNGMKIRKTYEGQYQIMESGLETLGDESAPSGPIMPESEFDRITARKQRLSEILDVYPVPEIKFGHDLQALQDSITELRRLVKSRLNFINDEAQKIEAVEILHTITNSLGQKVVKPVTPRDKFIEAIVKQMPRFIYFSDFKDILPFEISIDALKSNQTVCDFANIARLDLDDVMATQDIQRRINLFSRASATISGLFFEHWVQDRIELIARPEGSKILFGVKEQSGTDFFKMEQRSRGFQWFLSFYLRVNRYQNENVVLLIDEPGMNLHPVAQKNILTVMEKRSSSSMQILFSTHSPALIDIQHLERIRCIVKNKESGSKITGKITDAVDNETLMPLATAMGVNSPEKLKALLSGERPEKEEFYSSSTADELLEPEAAPSTTAEATAAVRPEAETLSKEKAADVLEKEVEIEAVAPRKPLFKLFGR
ncbi:MAG: AAA family ATPase [Candidatus Omnitrophica bacterium]|nr:AAA family ATPase [Candidatus Omnitrophota bacterium]